MARFAKLRWIPMIFRAYHEVQTRLDAHVMEETIVDAPNPKAGQKSLPARPKPATISASPRQKNGKRQGGARTPIKGRAKTNGKLLKEIQSTNQKLERLTDIQEQLKVLDASLQDCNRQINELKALREQLKEETKQTNPPAAPPIWP